MSRILWLDDDLPDFPYVSYALRDMGCEVTPMFSVCTAFEYLSEARASKWDCLLLDAIVPMGRSDVHESVYEKMIQAAGRASTDYRYAGFLLLDALAEDRIAEKTVVLSLVPPARLTPELSVQLPIVEKLGLNLEILADEIRGVLKSHGGS